jgi:hypothetical protein
MVYVYAMSHGVKRPAVIYHRPIGCHTGDLSAAGLSVSCVNPVPSAWIT